MMTNSSARDPPIASSEPGCWEDWKKKYSLWPSDVVIAWKTLRQNIAMLTFFSILCTMWAIFVKHPSDKILLFSALQVVPGWFVLLFPTGRGRIVSSWCFLFTTGIWGNLMAACWLYGMIAEWNWDWADEWTITPHSSGAWGTVLYTIIFIQTLKYILLERAISLAAQPLLPTVYVEVEPPFATKQQLVRI